MEDMEGISPKTLADLLKRLREERLVGRESFNEIPPRVEYYLTDDGRTLREAIIPLLEWAIERDVDGNGTCTSPCENGPGMARKVPRKK
jgi:DNA-binding HxlR family transcriptional regulator